MLLRIPHRRPGSPLHARPQPLAALSQVQHPRRQGHSSVAEAFHHLRVKLPVSQLHVDNSIPPRVVTQCRQNLRCIAPLVHRPKLTRLPAGKRGAEGPEWPHPQEHPGPLAHLLFASQNPQQYHLRPSHASLRHRLSDRVQPSAGVEHGGPLVGRDIAVPLPLLFRRVGNESKTGRQRDDLLIPGDSPLGRGDSRWMRPAACASTPAGQSTQSTRGPSGAPLLVPLRPRSGLRKPPRAPIQRRRNTLAGAETAPRPLPPTR